jgi:predicted alpha/beta hydrolase
VHEEGLPDGMFDHNVSGGDIAMQTEALRADETVVVRARDGGALAADLHLPPKRPRTAILLAPAMGVKRSYYRPFARSLAERGAAVLVPDYRGIGGSRAIAKPDTRLRDWADLDIAGALDHLALHFPNTPLRYMGHSVGGQLFGLLERQPVERALFVGSQSGYWGHWDGVLRAVMGALWFAAVPAFVRTIDKLPMKALGQGEDVPGGVGREWAEWGRHPRYIGVQADARPDCFFSTFRGPICAYAIDDDGYAPRRAVAGLLAEFRVADKELRVVRPHDVGEKSIGHFGALKKTGAALWPSMHRFLLPE